MKKYFALIIAAVLILTCFTACKAKLKGGAVISDGAGKSYAAVTKEGGGIVRDEAGNLIEYATNERGGNIKDDNGEYVTNPIAFEHAIVIGNTIEMPTFSIQIPDGWANSLSQKDLIIKRNGTEDVLKIQVLENESLGDIISSHTSIINITKSQFPATVAENKAVKIGDKDAQFYSAFVPEANGASVYLAYIFFEHNNNVYSCHINSNRDISGDIDEFTDILATIKYVR